MEFGMFHEFQRSRGQSETEAFDQSFEQIDAAEEWGLDVMWLAELHAAPTRSVLSAPLNVATAIATRTSRMKIGTAVHVLPLCHPLRVAEEAATVDQISHGRLIFGVGRSGFPRTYQAYGIPYEESRERFAETLKSIAVASFRTRRSCVRSSCYARRSCRRSSKTGTLRAGKRRPDNARYRQHERPRRSPGAPCSMREACARALARSRRRTLPVLSGSRAVPERGALVRQDRVAALSRRQIEAPPRSGVPACRLCMRRRGESGYR